MSIEITYKQSAYIDTKYYDINQVKDGRTDCVSLTRPEGSDYLDQEGYTRIGTATVVLMLHDDKEIISNQMDALNKQLAATRADNQRRENAILDRISKLQALTFVSA